MWRDDPDSPASCEPDRVVFQKTKKNKKSKKFKNEVSEELADNDNSPAYSSDLRAAVHTRLQNAKKNNNLQFQFA